jgi:hypothetical protein
MMTVYRLLAPKEVGERSGWGCVEGSPIVVDLLVACRREERACDVDRSVLHPLVSMSISEAAKDTRAGQWVE